MSRTLRFRIQKFRKSPNHVGLSIENEPRMELHLITGKLIHEFHRVVKNGAAGYRECFAYSTPPSTSWLHRVERFWAEITNQVIRVADFLRNSSHQAIMEYVAENDDKPKPFAWITENAVTLRLSQTLLNELTN